MIVQGKVDQKMGKLTDRVNCSINCEVARELQRVMSEDCASRKFPLFTDRRVSEFNEKYNESMSITRAVIRIAGETQTLLIISSAKNERNI